MDAIFSGDAINRVSTRSSLGWVQANMNTNKNPMPCKTDFIGAKIKKTNRRLKFIVT